MSNRYSVLIDPDATAATAVERAHRIRDHFVERGIIQPEPDNDCVLAGSGHRPGPALAEIYPQPPNSYFFSGETCGVEFMPDRYINDFGWIVFEHAVCPNCDRRHGPDEIQDSLFSAIGAFMKGTDSPLMTCPACQEAIEVHRWQMLPPMGFCHLQIRFWNWPPFDDDNWTASIPEIASHVVGSKLIVSWGRV